MPLGAPYRKPQSTFPSRHACRFASSKDARGVEQFKNGAVAFAKVCLCVGRFDKPDRIFDGEMDGESLFEARRGDELRGVQLDDAFAHQELKEGAERSELARNGSLFLLRGVQAGEPLADRDVVNLFDVNFAARVRVLRVCGREVIVELSEVARIVAQGVLADVALVSEVLEELRK